MSLLPHTHVVDFYEEDTELASRVASYLAEGLRGGEAVVLIVTPGHRLLYERALRQAGVDVEWYRATSRLIEIDAETLLQSLLVDGEVDPDRFDETFRAILSSAGSAAGLRVVGEMVHLLWARGDLLTALDLETEGNRLAEESGVPLYCCYGTGSLAGDADALAQIRGLHDGVAPSSSVGWAGCRSSETFSPEPTSAAAARRFAAEVLGSWGVSEGIDAVNLVVSELASNALLHAETPFELTLSLLPERLLITVRDSSPVAPVLRETALTETSGRGLAIVAACAEKWGVEPDGAGKSVWAELDLHSGSRA